MAEYIDIPFIGAAYKARSVDANAQECINWYTEVDDKSAKTPIALYPTPGLPLVKSAGSGKHRGSLDFKGKAYFVVGSEVVEMDSNENSSTIGNLSTSSGDVSMASNGTQGDQLMLADGTSLYMWTGSVFSTITLGFTASPEFVVFIDSYFVINNKSTGQFYRSALNDGDSWNSGLDFATAERDPDDLKAMIVNQRELWLLGEQTTEVWYNDGSDFGFVYGGTAQDDRINYYGLFEKTMLDLPVTEKAMLTMSIDPSPAGNSTTSPSPANMTMKLARL